MRIKIKPKRQDFPKQLIFGKRYWLGYRGSNYSEEFTFSRKNKILVKNNWNNSVNWVAKKELKKILIQDECMIHFLLEIKEE